MTEYNVGDLVQLTGETWVDSEYKDKLVLISGISKYSQRVYFYSELTKRNHFIDFLPDLDSDFTATLLSKTKMI